MNIIKSIVQFFVSLFKKNKLAENTFGTGCVPQPEDKRDYKMSLGSGSFDWNTGYDVEADLTAMWSKPFQMTTEDQDGSSSCVGQASSMYASVLNYVEKGKWEKLSARDIYSWIYLLYGGAYLRDSMSRIVEFGLLPEKECPSYENGQPPSEVFMRNRFKEVPQFTNMVRDLTKSVEYVSVPTSIDEFAKAITLHKGMILGVRGDNNGTWFSEFPVPPTKSTWGHALYACRAKMINGKKYIGFKNSWGNVGVNGFQWLGEEWFNTNNVFDGWILFDRGNQVDREADFQKVQKAIDAIEPTLPTPGTSIYHSENWPKVLTMAGVPDITWGMYYDWAMVQKFRKDYNI